MNTKLIDTLNKGLHLEKCDVILPWNTLFDDLIKFGQSRLVKHSDQRSDIVWTNEIILNGLETNLTVMRWTGIFGTNRKLKSAFGLISQIDFERFIDLLDSEFGQTRKYKKINELECKYIWYLENVKVILSQRDRFGTYYQIDLKYRKWF